MGLGLGWDWDHGSWIHGSWIPSKNNLGARTSHPLVETHFQILDFKNLRCEDLSSNIGNPFSDFGPKET